MEVFRNEFGILSYDSQTRVLEQIWTKETVNMTEKDYMNYQLMTVEQFVKNKANKIYVYFKDFGWPIGPEIQVWTNDNIIKPLINNGITKISYIIPQDILSQLSMEQTLEENKSMGFPFKYFSDEIEAKEWLLS